MKATFENSMDILIKAYLDDTLMHGNCFACAVGNLVASSMNIKFEKQSNGEFFKKLRWEGVHPDYYPSRTPKSPDIGWGAVFCTNQGHQEKELDEYIGTAKNQIDSTGYTVNELAQIELSFERARSDDPDERMFKGLVNVLNTLAEIHKVDFSDTKNYKDQLTEIFATKS